MEMTTIDLHRTFNKVICRKRSRDIMRKKRDTKNPHEYHCRCCGKQLEKRGLYCDECVKIIFRVYHRTYEQQKRMTEGSKLIGKELAIMHDVHESDISFSTDLCDMNCDFCKFEDCILPEEN